MKFDFKSGKGGMFGMSLGDPVANASAGLYLLVDNTKTKDAVLLLENLVKPKEKSTGGDEIHVWVLASEIKDGTKHVDVSITFRQSADTPAYLLAGIAVCSMSPGTGNQIVARLSRTDDELLIDQDQWKSSHDDLVGWLKKRKAARGVQRREQVKRVPSDTRQILATTIPQTTNNAARMKLIDKLVDGGDIVVDSRFDELDRMVQKGCTVELDALTKQRSINNGRKRKTNSKQLVLGFDSTTANTTADAMMHMTRELVAAFDTDCAMTMMILLSEAAQHPLGYIEYSATKIKRAKGQSGKPQRDQRRNWGQHLAIMKDAEIILTPKDPKADGKKIPFLIKYGESFDQETGKTTVEHIGINPVLLPAIWAGMGHYIESAIFRANTQNQDWEIRIYTHLSFLWSMSGTHKTVNDKSQAMRITLGRLLDSAGIDYADRWKKQGTSWLRDRVEQVFEALCNWDDGTECRSLFGDIRTEWNTDDILKSMITTTPPLHLLEEMQEKRSKTIEASKRRKAKREAKDQKLIEAK